MKRINTLLKNVKLVDNAAKAYKMWSNRSAAAAAILAMQEALPIWEGVIPENVFAYLAAGVATAGIYFRLVDQGLSKK